MTLENIINGFKRIAVTGLLGLSMYACGEPEGNGGSGGCVSNVECHAPRVCYRGECVEEEDIPENNDDNSNNNVNGSAALYASCDLEGGREGSNGKESAIFLLNGSDYKEVYRVDGKAVSSLSISPDSSSIAAILFDIDDYSVNYEVHLVNIDTSQGTIINNEFEYCSEIAWLSNSEFVTSCDSSYDNIILFNINGGSSLLTRGHNDRGPAIDKDKKNLYFIRNDSGEGSYKGIIRLELNTEQTESFEVTDRNFISNSAKLVIDERGRTTILTSENDFGDLRPYIYNEDGSLIPMTRLVGSVMDYGFRNDKILMAISKEGVKRIYQAQIEEDEIITGEDLVEFSNQPSGCRYVTPSKQ